MIKRLTLLLGLLAWAFVPHDALAQAEAHNSPGFVVDMKGDTLRGWLDVPQFVTDHGLRFRPQQDGASQRLYLADVRAFGLADGRRFVRRRLANGINQTTGKVDSTTVFLQQVVAGAASLYRYDENVSPHRADAYTPSETVQFFASVSGGALAPLYKRSHPAAVVVLLKDCGTLAEEIRRVSFNQDALSSLFLHYNAQCHPGTPSHDQRLPPPPPNPVQVHLSLRGGIQQTSLYYTHFSQFERQHVTGARNPSFSGEVRLGLKRGAWSLGVGLLSTQHQSRANYSLKAFRGTTNEGQLLDLSSDLKLQMVQVRVLLYYTLGHGRVQPYAAAGLSIGQNRNLELTQRYPVLTQVGATGSPPPLDRQDVVTETSISSNTDFSGGGTARAGLRLVLAPRLAPLLEVEYNAGEHYHNMLDYGKLRYQSWGVSAGFEF